MSGFLGLLMAVGVEDVDKFLHRREGRLQADHRGNREEYLNKELTHGALHPITRTVDEPVGQLLRAQAAPGVKNTQGEI